MAVNDDFTPGVMLLAMLAFAGLLVVTAIWPMFENATNAFRIFQGF